MTAHPPIPESASPLDGIPLLLGVTGGIACYKAADLASRLVKLGAALDVVMTPAATRFVAPLTFQTLSRRTVHVDLWQDGEARPEHIALAQRPRAVLIAPLTANTLAKLALGLADNLLTSTCLACRAPLLLAPAMNTAMWEHQATQGHMTTMRARGAWVIGPGSGRLACGDAGAGRMAEPAEIVAGLLDLLASNQSDIVFA